MSADNEEGLRYTDEESKAIYEASLLEWLIPHPDGVNCSNNGQFDAGLCVECKKKGEQSNA